MKQVTATPQTLRAGGCDSLSHAHSHQSSQVKAAVLERRLLHLQELAALERQSPGSRLLFVCMGQDSSAPQVHVRHLPSCYCTAGFHTVLAVCADARSHRSRRCIVDGSQVMEQVHTIHLWGIAALERQSPASQLPP